MAKKQGKNGTCTAWSAVADSGVGWLRLVFLASEKQRVKLLYCPQATGCIHGSYWVEIDTPKIRPKTDFYVRRNIARCVSRNKKCDCNLLNNRFLKKKSITMGNDIETSELL